MIIFFILVFIITAKATEDTKYIDLLPEKDKDVFIDRVARRILEEVDSKPSQQKSGEVNKDELDVHAEFVKKILREEEANLRKRNTNDKEDLKVKPLNKDRKTIDLTLRSRTRRNNNKSFRRNFDTVSDLKNNDEQNGIKTNPASTSDDENIQVNKNGMKSKDNDPKVETEANNGEVQTISTDNVVVETENPTTKHQDKVVRINTFDFGNAEESKRNTSSVIGLNTKPEEIQSYSKNNTSQNINYENKKVNEPIDETETTKKPDEAVSLKEDNGLGNMSFLDIPVKILRAGDSVMDIETSSQASTVPTTEEATYTTTLKQVDNIKTVEKGETTTGTNKTELEAKENIKRDVNAVTDKIETHEELNDKKTEKLHVKNFRTNTVNFGDIDESQINITNTNITNDNLFIDVETTSKSSVTVDLKSMRVKPLTEKHNSDKNDELVSASSEKMDIISEVNKDIITEDKIIKENIKGTFKSANRKNDDDDIYVKPNIYTIKKIKQVDIKYIKPEFEVTTQRMEVLTPLIPLISQYSTKTNENEEKHTKDVDSDIVRVLRDVIDRNRANGKFSGLKSIYKANEHKVYEIPKTDKILFIDNTMNQEQPYYYPIYNYSPNNAYYNAHNNFGPNQNDFEFQRKKDHEDDDRWKENFQTDYFFDENNNRNFKTGNSDDTDQTKQKYEIKLPVVVKYHNELNNDYDYIARTGDGMLYNNKYTNEDRLKSSLRDIRMMMYANKMFGNIPHNNYVSIEDDSSEVTTKKSKSLRANFEAILKREKKDRDDGVLATDSSIAVDYYFSRMNSYSDTNEIENEKETNTGLTAIKGILQRIFNKNNYRVYEINPEDLKRRIYYKRNKKRKINFEKIQKIVNLTNEVDMIPVLNKLLKMKISRSGLDEKEVEIYADVLADLIQTDNTALVQYDWLGTTVNIQGATLKLLELTHLVLSGKYINPSDLELLKYAIHLYKEASLVHGDYDKLRMKLPRGKNMKRRIIKTYSPQWLNRQSDGDSHESDRSGKNDVELFSEFLEELLNSLYELHTAITHIASITKYNHQHWFKNLKELYLDGTKNRTLELLLHLATNRVLDIVEKSAKNGLEYDYLKYVKQNEKEVKRATGEIMFLLKIINEIESYE